MKKVKEQKGITLVALVVTIVVLLILAGVTITYVFSDNGILSQAQTAANKTDVATVLEEIQSKLLARQLVNTDTWTYSNTDVIEVIEEVTGVTVDEWDDDFYTENGNKVTISSLWVGKISTTDSFVGYLADVDGDGTVDGIIFADLMVAAKNSPWGDERGTYSWDVLTDGVKEYYISEADNDDYSSTFGIKDVISSVDGTTGENRFYVMALEDVDSSTHAWYYNAYSNGMTNYASDTSGDFGTGFANTGKMIEIWEGEDYGTKNGYSSCPDVWGLDAVQTGYTNGWFVPSRGEWAAFAGQLGITRG